MECTKDEIYFLIKSARRKYMKSTETFNFVNNAWPDHCPCFRPVRRLCKEFREATRENFERKPGQGRPQSETRRNSLTSVEELIKADGFLTIAEFPRWLEYLILWFKELCRKIWKLSGTKRNGYLTHFRNRTRQFAWIVARSSLPLCNQACARRIL